MHTSDEITRPQMLSSEDAACSFPILDPEFLERFELGELLGHGAYGQVYRAVDTALEREVALKVFGQHVPLAYVRHEALALARIEHKNVLSIHDLRVVDARSFLVMELALGGSLKRRVPRSHDWREIVDWYAQAARGLEALHNAGLAHGDIKPSNILVHGDGRVVVADLGLVHGPRLEWRGRKSAGTPLYMAPERARGALADVPGDQFSLAVAIWEALFGEQLEVSSEGIRLRRVRTLRRFEQIPRELALGLRQGMSEEPKERFEHIGELASLLETHARAPCSWSARLWRRIARSP